MGKARVVNPAGKMRKLDNPYAKWKWKGRIDGEMMEFEYRLLKSWQAVNDRHKNPYARWMMAVKSPMTYGMWDIGDTYLGDVLHTLNVGMTDLEVDETVWEREGLFMAWAFNED